MYVEEYAGARTKSGVITTLMGVAILAITKKFKAASTAAKTLNYIVGTLGANMTIEGASDIYYGVTDDIYSESTNILLQYICQGNEDFYNGVVNFVSTLYSLIVPLDGIIASGGISMNAIITSINDVGISSVVQGATLDISIQTAVNLLGQIMGVDPENSYLFGSVLGTTIGVSSTGGDNTPNVHVGDDVVESGTGSKFQEVFDVADNYTLSDDTFNNHILDRHGPNSTYGNKSHFNVDFDIRQGIDSTLKGDNFVLRSNTAGREGYIFEQTFANPIGTNNRGKPLYTLKVVIDESGNVITAFPK